MHLFCNKWNSIHRFSKITMEQTCFGSLFISSWYMNMEISQGHSRAYIKAPTLSFGTTTTIPYYISCKGSPLKTLTLNPTHEDVITFLRSFRGFSTAAEGGITWCGWVKKPKAFNIQRSRSHWKKANPDSVFSLKY